MSAHMLTAEIEQMARAVGGTVRYGHQPARPAFVGPIQPPRYEWRFCMRCDGRGGDGWGHVCPRCHNELRVWVPADLIVGAA